jgi:hypothetical protein
MFRNRVHRCQSYHTGSYRGPSLLEATVAPSLLAHESGRIQADDW